MTSARRVAGTSPRPFPGANGVLETRAPEEHERAAHERRLAPDLGRQRAVRGDPTARPSFTGFQLLHVDAGLTPREASLADEPEGVGEVLGRGGQPLGGELASTGYARLGCLILRCGPGGGGRGRR